MVYLSHFRFPNADDDFSMRYGDYRGKMTCFGSMYPFGILSERGLESIDFEPITILCGGNGSGKTTALNVIAEKMSMQRDTLFNRSPFFDDYVKICRYETMGEAPANARVITSDDVFDFMQNLRMINDGIDARREELFDEYWNDRHAHFQVRSLEDYDQLRKVNLARSKTPSKYVKNRMMGNVREQSNGESALFYFQSRIQDDGIYLLDEPENSLSPQRQLELVTFIENQARFFKCQFVIATHSPFLMCMRGAKIYDLDSSPACVKKWTQLSSVRAYFDFFMEHREQLEE